MVAFVRAVVSRLHVQVDAVATAAEALLRTSRGDVEVVLLDLGLPDAGGEALFARLRAAHPTLPVAVMTGDNSADRAIRLMRDGAVDYLIKPIRPDALQTRIEGLCERLTLQREWQSLRPLYTSDAPALVVGTDPTMAGVLRRATMLARTDAPVLITGETGTGKERIARAIHDGSSRKDAPFVAVNLGAIPLSLWESEFFGHVRGAFTDAREASAGLVGRAAGGTLFLDEVAECPPAAQMKLLRFLQEREYRPVGGARDLHADVRILAATNRDLKQQVERGAFREDLYYRLHVLPLHIPALRERRSDVPLLAQRFLDEYAGRFRTPARAFAGRALDELTAYAWPGNVRELENVVQQAVAVAVSEVLELEDLPALGGETPTSVPATPYGETVEPFAVARDEALGRFEREYLVRVLELAGGNITRAATLAAMPRKSLWRLLQRHDIHAVRDGIVSKAGRPRRVTIERRS